MCPVIIAGASCLALISLARKWHKTAAPRTHGTLTGLGEESQDTEDLQLETCLICCFAGKAHSKGETWQLEGGGKLWCSSWTRYPRPRPRPCCHSYFIHAVSPLCSSSMLPVAFSHFFFPFSSVSKLSINVRSGWLSCPWSSFWVHLGSPGQVMDGRMTGYLAGWFKVFAAWGKHYLLLLIC